MSLWQGLQGRVTVSFGGRVTARAWRAVELYDRWLRGEVLKAREEGEYEDEIECGEVEVKGLPEAGQPHPWRRCATTCASATTASREKWSSKRATWHTLVLTLTQQTASEIRKVSG